MKVMWDSAVLEDKKEIAPPPSPPRPKQLSDQRGAAHVFHGSDFFYRRTSPLNTAWNSTFPSLVYFCMHNNKYSSCALLFQVYYRTAKQSADLVSPRIFLDCSNYLHALISTWIPNFPIVLHVFTTKHSFHIVFRVK